MTYTLSEAVELTGLNAQRIVHLIERHKLLIPSKEYWGKREIYAFSDEDLRIIRTYVKLIRLGYKNSEAVEKTRNFRVYQQVARKFFLALKSGNKKELLKSLFELPGYDKKDLSVLIAIESMEKTMTDIAVDESYTADSSMLETIQSLRREVGKELFFLIQLTVDTDWL